MAYEVQSIPAAGRGLVCNKNVTAGRLILQDDAPFVAVLDSHVLTKACSWCFTHTEEGSPWETKTVSACTGCKIVRYCGKPCQTASWKHSHKYECKVFKALYPQVLPNLSRMIIQILLRHKNNAISQEEWNSFLKLEHHMDALDKSRGSNDYHQDTMENLQLMARAGKEYSSTAESLKHVETLMGRLITNTMTLSTPLYTPIGLVMSLSGSLLNHSCAPNSSIVFNGRTVEARAIESLASGTELTISYTNTSMNVNARRKDLQNRYHFTCNCAQCSHGLTLGRPDDTSTLQSFPNETARLTFESEVNSLMMDAKAVPVGPALKLIAKAYQLCKKYPEYPKFLAPLYSLRFDLHMVLLANRYFVAAFIQSMIIHFKVQPVVYPSLCHPARVGRGWSHAKFTGHLGNMAREPEPTFNAIDEGAIARALAQRFSLDWGMVVYFLVKEVSDQILKSHGLNSKLAREVGREYQSLNEQARETRKEPSKDDFEKVRSSLIMVANEGWDWWIQEMRANRVSGKLLGSSNSDDVENAIDVLFQ